MLLSFELCSLKILIYTQVDLNSFYRTKIQLFILGKFLPRLFFTPLVNNGAFSCLNNEYLLSIVLSLLFLLNLILRLLNVSKLIVLFL